MHSQNVWESTITVVGIILLLTSSSLSEPKYGEPDNGRNKEYYKNYNTSRSFLQIPHSNPPTVRPPPYTISQEKCPEMNMRENWVDTLCGDLNTGFVPQNPLGHQFPDGGTYPFDTIKNKTLDFFRRALPILKNTKSLPKVARYSISDSQADNVTRERRHHRGKRGIATRQKAYPSPLLDPYYPEEMLQIEPPSPLLPSQRRTRHYGPGPSYSNHNRFCDNVMNYYHRLCKIYNVMWGKAPYGIHREGSLERNYHRSKHAPRPSIDVTVIEPSHKTSKHLQTSPSSSLNDISMPPTPCPSSAEYMTPVFARNHEGAWRYVVQIPKEGYFTQTVEVTKCLKSNCFYMDGSCKTSPRWQSLLVAELYYPDATFPTVSTTSVTSGGGERETVRKSRKTDPSQCDGFDSIGCYQVRLFYDWFLIPGSCKCWKNQFDFTSRPNYL